MIQVIIGPMFSGKTTELLRRIRRYEIAGKKCLRIKYSGDDRYEKNQMTTHDMIKSDAINCKNLMLIGTSNYDVIGIDEGQFMENLVDFCDTNANNGKIIIIAGLDSDYNINPFSNICTLICKAEVVHKLRAVCTCGEEASFNYLMSNEKHSIEIIGGADKYKSLCRSCYNKLK